MSDTDKKRPYLAFDSWEMEAYEERWEEQEEDENGTSQFCISIFWNALDNRNIIMSLFENFLFGMCLGMLFAVAFRLGWRMGIDNYLRRAREHVEKYGGEYK